MPGRVLTLLRLTVVGCCCRASACRCRLLLLAPFPSLFSPSGTKQPLDENLHILPTGEAGHLLWVSDPSQPDLCSRPTDMAEALTLREQQGRIEVGWRGRDTAHRSPRRTSCASCVGLLASLSLLGHPPLPHPHLS